MSAQTSVRSALIAQLRGDPALTDILGGERVFDGAPRGTRPPFVDLANIETRLLAADPSEGERHQIDVLMISSKSNRGQAADALAAIRAALADIAVHLAGHHLVVVSNPVMRTDRLRNGRGWRGRLRVTLLTEPGA